MRSVRVGPLDRFRMAVRVADVAHEFPREVRHGGEDAARDYISFDFREPQLYLIEPRAVGRRVMQMDPGMILKELPDALGFVGGEIVGDDLDLPPTALLGEERRVKGDKRFAGVTRGRFAVDRSGGGVQGCIQRQRAAPNVFEPMSFRPTERGRQDGQVRSNAWIAVFSSTQKMAAC